MRAAATDSRSHESFMRMAGHGMLAKKKKRKCTLFPKLGHKMFWLAITFVIGKDQEHMWAE